MYQPSLSVAIIYAAACALGNIYLIFIQESIYHCGTLLSFIACICSSVSSFVALPLRTISIILNAIFGGSPLCSKYVIILSRVPITSEIVQVPFLIRSAALPIHTSVPCDRPEICSRSEKVFGCDSISICLTKGVPTSGKENVPVSQSISSGSIPKACGDVNSEITSGSLIDTSITGMPVNISR